VTKHVPRTAGKPVQDSFPLTAPDKAVVEYDPGQPILHQIQSQNENAARRQPREQRNALRGELPRVFPGIVHESILQDPGPPSRSCALFRMASIETYGKTAWSHPQRVSTKKGGPIAVSSPRSARLTTTFPRPQIVWTGGVTQRGFQQNPGDLLSQCRDGPACPTGISPGIVT